MTLMQEGHVLNLIFIECKMYLFIFYTYYITLNSPTFYFITMSLLLYLLLYSSFLLYYSQTK